MVDFTKGELCPDCGSGYYNALLNEQRHTPDCNWFAAKAEPDIEIIQAQAAGEDIFENPGFMSVRVDEMVKVRDVLNEAIGKYDGALELVRAGEVAETNFGLYVDGYTLSSTDKIGEIKLTAHDGRTKIVTSRALTEWIERRLEPVKD